MAASDLLTTLGGFYRDIEVAKESNNGTTRQNVRPESVPDQTSVGVANPAGPSNSSAFGIQFNSSILLATVGVVAAIAALRYIR